MGIFSRYVGDTVAKISRKGLDADRQVVNVLDWHGDNDDDGTTQEVNWHRHMTRGTTWLYLIYYGTI